MNLENFDSLIQRAMDHPFYSVVAVLAFGSFAMASCYLASPLPAPR